MKSSVRRLFLGVALLATTALAWFVPSVQNNPVKPAGLPEIARDSAVLPARPLTELLTIRPREPVRVEAGDPPKEPRLFATANWTPPPPPPVPVVVAPPPPPEAPPLPFRAIGRYDDSAKTVVFLQHPQQTLSVRVGEIIVDEYKVESLRGSTLTLRYLPMNKLQTLEVGEPTNEMK